MDPLRAKAGARCNKIAASTPPGHIIRWGPSRLRHTPPIRALLADKIAALQSSPPSARFVRPTDVDLRVADSGTGASHHLTGDKTLFRGFVRSCSITVGGISGSLLATGVGKGCISINGHDLPLTRLFYVPGLAMSLISVSELVEDGEMVRGWGWSGLGFARLGGMSEVIERAFSR
jgi:hypothetical protein